MSLAILMDALFAASIILIALIALIAVIIMTPAASLDVAGVMVRIPVAPVMLSALVVVAGELKV